MKRKFFDINFFKDIENPNVLYVLGFFTADGSLVQNKRGGCYFAIQSKDKQIILEIKKVMKSEHKISNRKDKRTSSIFYRLQIGSKEIYKDLVNLGFSGNKTKNLPILKINKESFFHFVRGYFDGDGNIWFGVVHKKRKINHKNILLAFTSASFDFLNFLSLSLNKILGVRGSLFKGKTNYYRLQYSKKDALKIYFFMYNSNVPFICLNRKKKAFEKAINSLRP